MLASSAQAAGNTYTVTSTNDDATAVACHPDNSCDTLRDAIAAANADGQSDTIVFANGVSGTINLAQSNDPLTITDPGGLTINGPGSTALAIDGNHKSQIFVMQMASAGVPVSISGLTLQNGYSNGEGGAIDNGTYSSYHGANLSLRDVVITGSTAGDGPGGGIFTRGPLTVTNSTISGNTNTFNRGGGIAAAPFTSTGPKYHVDIDGSIIRGNSAYDGGGVEGGADFAITNSKVTGNNATRSNVSYGGGGIEALDGSLSLSNTTVSGNKSAYEAGGILSETNNGTSVTNSTVSGNTAANRGGGIEIATSRYRTAQNPISLSNSTVSGNSAANGAGLDLASDPAGTPVTISASTISGNTGGNSSEGGGILIAGTVYNAFDLIDSTISGNTASTGGGVGLGNGTSPLTGQGGSVAFDNSTIASNSADTQDGGGGIYLSEYSAGSPATEQSGTASLNSTIVAGNTAAGTGDDLSRASGSTTGGFNAAYSLIQNPGNAPLLSSQAVILGADPQLGPLANNGGPTQTMLPSNSSPVIDQGKAAPGLTTDQRGDPRTVDNGKPKPAGGDGTDIGSVELPSPPPPSPPAPTSGAPSPSPVRAVPIGTRGAAFSDDVNPDGLPTTAYFQYGLDRRYLQPGASGAQYDHQTPAVSVGSDFSPHFIAATVSGLVPNALYHVRLVAFNSAGTTVGPDVTFKTGKDPAPPPPVLGKSFDVTVVSGLVFFHLPHGGTAADHLAKGVGFVPLTEARQLPAGTQIDARQGTLKLITATGRRHKTQSGNFGGGLFGMSQDRRGISKGLTTLSLLEGLFSGAPSYSSCTAKSADAFGPSAFPARLSSKVLQTLHSTAKGKFRTRGRYAAATVRGTAWTISDRCNGTLITVQRHTVAVTDFVRHITLQVHQGHHYLAKAPRSRRR